MKKWWIFGIFGVVVVGILLIGGWAEEEPSPEPAPKPTPESGYIECIDADGGVIYDNYFRKDYCGYNPRFGLYYAYVSTCRENPISGRYSYEALVDFRRIFCPNGCQDGACIEGEKYFEIIETSGSYEVDLETGKWSYEKEFLVDCSLDVEYLWQIYLCPYKTTVTDLEFIDPEHMLKDHAIIESPGRGSDVLLSHISHKKQKLTMEYVCNGMLLLHKHVGYTVEFLPLVSKEDKITFKVPRDFKHCIDEWGCERPIQKSFNDNLVLYEMKECATKRPLAILTNIEEDLNAIQNMHNNSFNKFQEILNLKWKNLIGKKKIKQLNETLMLSISSLSDVNDKSDEYPECQEIYQKINSAKSYFSDFMTSADETTSSYNAKVDSYKRVPFVGTTILHISNWIAGIFQ